MSRIVAFYGPSCSGKTEVQKKLLQDFKSIVTATTRAPRRGEIDGVNYHFYSEEQFLRAYENGELLEKNNYLGNWYGVPLNSIENALKSEEIRTVILEVNGIKVLKEKYKDEIFTIYIGANKESLLRRFIEERKSNDDEIMSRLSKALTEEMSPQYISYADLILWNNDGVNFDDILIEIKNNIELLKQ